LWTIAVNRNQNLLGKTMLVLNRPCTSVVEVTSEEWMVLHDRLRVLVPTLTALFRPDQFNLAFLMNQDAHVHLHIIPAYAAFREWNGLLGVPGSAIELSARRTSSRGKAASRDRLCVVAVITRGRRS